MRSIHDRIRAGREGITKLQKNSKQSKQSKKLPTPKKSKKQRLVKETAIRPQQLNEVKLSGRKSPAWKAYNDSLNLFNKSENDIKKGRAYDYHREYYNANPDQKKRYEKLLGESVDTEIKKYGARDYAYYKSGAPKRNAQLAKSGRLMEMEEDGVWIFQEDYTPKDWKKPLVPLSDKIQPTEVLIGPESEPIPIYKKPTKPKEKGINRIKSRSAVKFKTPIGDVMPDNIWNPETIPYNISDKVITTFDGQNYIEHQGKLKKKQTRQEYRDSNLRPNGKKYKRG